MFSVMARGTRRYTHDAVEAAEDHRQHEHVGERVHVPAELEAGVQRDDTTRAVPRYTWAESQPCTVPTVEV